VQNKIAILLDSTNHGPPLHDFKQIIVELLLILNDFHLNLNNQQSINLYEVVVHVVARSFLKVCDSRVLKWKNTFDTLL
jgi:hypothetical protein